MTNRGSGDDLMQYWRALCKKNGATYRPSAAEIEPFKNLRPDFQNAQIKWAMGIYLLQMPYPSAKDFCEFIRGMKQDLPDAIVAEAYRSGRPLLIDMADSLETLRSAYFPTADVEAQIESLEDRLKAALA